jgi:hypothetical protein
LEKTFFGDQLLQHKFKALMPSVGGGLIVRRSLDSEKPQSKTLLKLDHEMCSMLVVTWKFISAYGKQKIAFGNDVQRLDCQRFVGECSRSAVHANDGKVEDLGGPPSSARAIA